MRSIGLLLKGDELQKLSVADIYVHECAHAGTFPADVVSQLESLQVVFTDCGSSFYPSQTSRNRHSSLLGSRDPAGVSLSIPGGLAQLDSLIAPFLVIKQDSTGCLSLTNRLLKLFHTFVFLTSCIPKATSLYHFTVYRPVLNAAFR